jgi:hypothetical protein
VALWFAISVFFGVSVRILLFPFFLHPVFLDPSLGKGLIISGDTFINPAVIPSSLLSMELEVTLAGSGT